MTTPPHQPSLAKGLLHCTLCMCCPCVTVSSCLRGTHNKLSACCFQNTTPLEEDSCRYFGMYNGIMFSATMCISGYDHFKRTCCVDPVDQQVVQTDMNRN